MIYSVDSLSLSKIGDKLRERLDDESLYTFPDEFEKAVVDIDFKGIVTVGETSPYDKMIVIGNGLYGLPRANNGNVINNTLYKAIEFIASDNVLEIPAYSLTRQTLLTSVTIPDSVTSIGGSAFQGCTGLTSVTIPDSVTSIGGSAFYGCTGLTSVTIPDSVTSIGGYAFNGCTGLTSVTIEDGDKISYPNDNSGWISGDAKLLTAGVGNTYNIDITGVTSIPDNMFRGSRVQTVVLPSGVTSIGGYAFQGCTGLTSVTIPDSVTSIGGSAFYGCTGLTSVTIPDSVTSIGGYAFNGCTGLKTIVIPSVSTFEGNNNSNGTFRNCTSLTSATLGSIGSPVNTIQNYAFYGCTNTSTVITVYLAEQNIDTLVASIRNGLTRGTIVVKAANDLVYNGVNYSAGDTVLTSTP